MELVKKENAFSSALTELEDQKKMCQMLLSTPHYAKLGAEGIYAVLAKAKSLDIDPFDALNGALYFVKGKVGMSTEAMAARVRSAGHSIQKDPKSTNTCCILIGKRADNGDTWTTCFSIDDAKRAGIYGGTWEKYPSVMCYNRAMSMMFRQMTPDLSKGAGYDYDELKEIAASKGHDIEVMPTIAPVKQLITAEQANELADIFCECNPDFVKRVWKHLNINGINKLEQLDIDLYDRVKMSAISCRDNEKNAELISQNIPDNSEETEEEPQAEAM